MRRARAATVAFGIAIATFATSCAPSLQAVQRPSSKVMPLVAAAAAIVEAPSPVPESEPMAFGTWEGFGVAKCSYLAPKNDFVADDGGVDVVVHFHAGQMSTRDMQESGVRGVFVSCGYGLGTGGYGKAFEDPRRFGMLMKSLVRTIARKAKRPRDAVHVRHLALVSWSAGFASVNRVLAVPEWYAATDTVILLDSLHAGYTEREANAGKRAPAEPSRRTVDVKMLRRFERFATDAVHGKKTMIITHSAILPPDYASTAEATAALLADVGVTPHPADAEEPVPGSGAFPSSRASVARTMRLSVRADEGDLHVRGFRGTGPHDHFDHLHLIGDTLRSWVVPRWYTPSQ